MISLSNGSARLSRPMAQLATRRQQRAALYVPAEQVLSSETAQKLHDGGFWAQKSSRPRQTPTRDRTRVNIVSEKLCDDVLNYIGPSLRRHGGCDLVDLSPGAGVWSRKLHEFLQPRRHIMMDIDAEAYRPFVADLTALRNVKVVPKSGIIWRDLVDTLREELPHLEEEKRRLKPDAVPERNDTLLMTANLAMYPKRPFLGFDNISVMVLHQLVASIRTSNFFQRYGLVRMLIWTNDMDKRRLLPRTVARRRRSACDAELSCEWVHEVAGLDTMVEMRTMLRDEWINAESACATVARMQQAGLTMPAHRQTHAYKNVLQNPDLIGKQLAGTLPPKLLRPHMAEFEELKKKSGFASLKGTKQHKNPIDEKFGKIREMSLRNRIEFEKKEATAYLNLLRRLEEIAKLAADSPKDFLHLNGEWNADIDSLSKNRLNMFNLIRDNYRVFRQKQQPILMWDRRLMEPLAVRADEFYPNAPLTLLDLQPKVMRPIFREMGPGTSRSGEIADLVLRYWVNNSLMSVRRAMDNIWAGFGDLIGQCHTLFDPSEGGTPVTRHGALTVRVLNERQMAQVIEALVTWSFCPKYSELVHRLLDEGVPDAEEEDTTRSAANNSEM